VPSVLLWAHPGWRAARLSGPASASRVDQPHLKNIPLIAMNARSIVELQPLPPSFRILGTRNRARRAGQSRFLH
jgi:hypothetical protein